MIINKKGIIAEKPLILQGGFGNAEEIVAWLRRIGVTREEDITLLANEGATKRGIVDRIITYQALLDLRRDGLQLVIR